MAQKTQSKPKTRMIIFGATAAVAVVIALVAINHHSAQSNIKPPAPNAQMTLHHGHPLPPLKLPPKGIPSAALSHLAVAPAPNHPAQPVQSHLSSAAIQKQQETAAVTLLQNASHGVAMAVSSFTGPDGFVGIIYQSPSPDGGFIHGLAWVLPKQKMVFLGDLIDSKGNMVAGAPEFALHTLRHPLTVGASTATTSSSAKTVTDHPVATTAPSQSASFANAVDHSVFSGHSMSGSGAYIAAYNDQNSVLEGHSGPIVTVFFDPDSESAFALYKEMSNESHKGLIRVRWVPIAVKGQTSLQRAEYILTAPSPLAALRLNFNDYNVKLHQGGAPLLSNMNMMSQVDQSTAILSLLGHPDSLAVFYCDHKTSTPVPIYGHQVKFTAIQKLIPHMGYHCD